MSGKISSNRFLAMDLSHLERDMAAMSDDRRTDPDVAFSHARQRSVLNLSGLASRCRAGDVLTRSGLKLSCVSMNSIPPAFDPKRRP